MGVSGRPPIVVVTCGRESRASHPFPPTPPAREVEVKGIRQLSVELTPSCVAPGESFSPDPRLSPL